MLGKLELKLESQLLNYQTCFKVVVCIYITWMEITSKLQMENRSGTLTDRNSRNWFCMKSAETPVDNHHDVCILVIISLSLAFKFIEILILTWKKEKLPLNIIGLAKNMKHCSLWRDSVHVPVIVNQFSGNFQAKLD